MDIRTAAACAAVLLCGHTGPALAEDAKTKVSFSFTSGSDYAFRGVSQSAESAAFQPGIEVSKGPLYAGAWTSNIDFADDTDAEIDLYAGIRPSAGGFDFDFGAIYYGYVDQPRGADWDYWEFKAAVSRKVGPVTLGAEVYYSPDYSGAAADDEAIYVEASASMPLTKKLSLGGAVGAQRLEGPLDYNTWHVGLTYQLLSFVAVDVRYHDTDEPALGDFGDSRVVVGLALTWP